MLFITVQSLPSFLTFPKETWIPRLRPRHVPLQSWALQVLVLTSGSLMNNWVFAFSVPLTIQIVFRSAGKTSCRFGVCPILKDTTRLSSVDGVRISCHEQEVFISADSTSQSRVFSIPRSYSRTSGCSCGRIYRGNTGHPVPTFLT